MADTSTATFIREFDATLDKIIARAAKHGEARGLRRAQKVVDSFYTVAESRRTLMDIQERLSKEIASVL